MPLWLQALFFGLFSALSLPLGALLGLAIKPSDRLTAKIMAFGAGSLVFAVATQLYGETLFKLLANSPDEFGGARICRTLCKKFWWHVILQIISGLAGAYIYRRLNIVIPRCISQRSHGSFIQTADVGMRMRDVAHGQDADVASSQTSQVDDVEAEASRRLHDRIPPTASMSPLRQESAEAERPNVALSMWLGLMLDGIPESLMMGFMTNQKKISFSFLAAVFIANFPESFAGAATLQRECMLTHKNLLLWFSVFAMTGFLAMIGSLIVPDENTASPRIERYSDDATVCLEGLTGGAMLAMVATAMIPEAFAGAKDVAGDLFVVGFVGSVFITGLGARYGSPQHHLGEPGTR
eukprot:TRINITY_DN42217_c0_g1_i1.p1 TRINITY_DN42217_c0_g1~~TRINITY_DN42217_c0_g1_i1.p1  ORF type:complete len:352 (-),score=32.48 TRINITY_DN42217_c0_g1_i1:111-1166(-)